MRKLSILLAIICITLAACGKTDKEPAEHIELVEPVMLETTEAETVSEEESTQESLMPTEAVTEEETVSLEESESEAVSETEAVSEGEEAASESAGDTAQTGVSVRVDGTYTSAADVAAYLNEFGRLPGNFITKKQAEKLGWEGGSLEPYAPGKCIGGDYFGNYEGLLPEKEGREYRECDIDTLGKRKRGAKRIIYSNDGLIYYTSDHYATFTLLYGEE